MCTLFYLIVSALTTAQEANAPVYLNYQQNTLWLDLFSLLLDIGRFGVKLNVVVARQLLPLFFPLILTCTED